MMPVMVLMSAGLALRPGRGGGSRRLFPMPLMLALMLRRIVLLRGSRSGGEDGGGRGNSGQQAVLQVHSPSQPCGRTSIQTAIAIIIKFSVSEMKPSGTLLSPPTHAHLSSRRST